MMLRRLTSAAPTCTILQCTISEAAGARRGAFTGGAVTQFEMENKGLKAGPGGRSSNSGLVATVFGCTGFLGRYIVNSLARQGSQVVMPYRCDDLDCQHLRLMGDLGQMVALKDFNVRDDDAVRYAIRRSNVVVNCIGAERETWNYEFDEVHVDIAQRIAEAAAANPISGDAAVRAAMPSATIFKPGPLIGNEDRLTNNIAALGKKYPVVPLVGGGRMRMQPVYVRDVADGMINSLRSRDALGKDYHMAGPEVITMRQLYEVVFATMREPLRTVPVPIAVARALAWPRERLFRKARPGPPAAPHAGRGHERRTILGLVKACVGAQLPIPWNTLFTQDFIDEMTGDHLLPSGVLTLQDLGVDPRPVTKGVPIEHIRHKRRGGYDFGSTYTLPAAKPGEMVE